MDTLWWTNINKPDGIKPVPAKAGVYDQTVPVSHSFGFIVKVGCQTFVSNNWLDVNEGLYLYFRNPDKAAKKYLKEEKQ